MPTAITLQVGRGDIWTTSIDVYAKLNYWPTEEGDGIFIGNVAIAPSSNKATIVWTPPVDSTDWKYSAVGKYMSITGPMGRLA